MANSKNGDGGAYVGEVLGASQVAMSSRAEIIEEKRETERLLHSKRPGDAAKLGVSEITLDLYRSVCLLDVEGTEACLRAGGDADWQGFDQKRHPLHIATTRCLEKADSSGTETWTEDDKTI